MAQLLLIKTDTTVAKAGDIVGTFDDNHVFTKTEEQVFNIVKVKDVSRSDVDKLRPITAEAVHQSKEGWVFEHELERKKVWKDADGNFKEIVEEKKYPLAYRNGLFVNNYAADTKNRSVLVAAEAKPVVDLVKG